jgi:hypothetical protein
MLLQRPLLAICCRPSRSCGLLLRSACHLLEGLNLREQHKGVSRPALHSLLVLVGGCRQAE